MSCVLPRVPAYRHTIVENAPGCCEGGPGWTVDEDGKAVAAFELADVGANGPTAALEDGDRSARVRFHGPSWTRPPRRFGIPRQRATLDLLARRVLREALLKLSLWAPDDVDSPEYRLGGALAA